MVHTRDAALQTEDECVCLYCVNPLTSPQTDKTVLLSNGMYEYNVSSKAAYKGLGQKMILFCDTVKFDFCRIKRTKKFGFSSVLLKYD